MNHINKFDVVLPNMCRTFFKSCIFTLIICVSINFTSAEQNTPAKEFFGRITTHAQMEPRVIGSYARGCLAGAKALAVNGENWQVMRLSRNRNWGHPNLISFLEEFANKVPKISSWSGILVGDLAQPRGGPMLSGHASHQIGLDADIWFMPMPKMQLSHAQREEMSAISMVRNDKLDVSDAWTPEHVTILKSAAEHPQVERILVNAAIKKAVCHSTKGDRGWLQKIRPYYGHDHHFHVRLKCPENDKECIPQDPTPLGDGCGTTLDYWFSESVLNPRKLSKPSIAKPAITLEQLPIECKMILFAK